MAGMLRLGLAVGKGGIAMMWLILGVIAVVTALMILGTRSPNRMPPVDPFDRTPGTDRGPEESGEDR